MEPDIIMITEVIPKAQVLPLSLALISIDGYNVYTNFDISQSNLGVSGYRGLCIYVKTKLISAEVTFGNPRAYEQLWIEVFLKDNDKLLVGCVYISPSGSRHQSTMEVIDGLKLACKSEPTHLLVGGDFNAPHIDWSNVFSPEPEGHFSHCMIKGFQDCFLTQHVLEPTRFRPGQPPSTLDLLLTNEEGMVSDLNYLPGLGLSDHVVLKFTLACYTDPHRTAEPKLNYNRGDFNLLRSILSKVDWSGMHDLNVHDAYDFFKDALEVAVDRSIPRLKSHSRKNLYMTKQAMRLKREKFTLWNIYVRSRDPVDYARFCCCRNRLRSLTRKLRIQFEKRISNELKSNPKGFWKYTNSRLKSKQGIEALKDETGVLCTDDESKARILNSFFSSVFTDEDVTSVPALPCLDSICLEDVNISQVAVKRCLEGLKTSSSPGPDGIHPRVLKEAAEQVAGPLATLFRKSLDAGVLPGEWKLGLIVPIFKKGPRSEPGNYRPVSLTAIPCKILETLIRNALMDHLAAGQLLHHDQHGFRQGRSCSSQLLEVMEDWSSCIEQGEAVDALYLDFKKAFDAVSHQRLLSKLESYGITGKLKGWIAAFLQDRQQRVVVRGSSSPWATVSSGVPQGSVLGPSLFILYINDLPSVVDSSIKIFADDTKIYRSVSSCAGSAELQKDLDAISAWSDEWQLPFNETKCKSLHIGSRNPCLTYRMHGIELEQVTVEKDLGVYLDSELKFRKQASAAAAKGNQLLALIKRSFLCIDAVTLPALYKTLVRPHLEYGNLIWGPFNRADQKLIERVQRRATKLVQVIRHLPYEERLKQLNIPSLHYRRRRGDMIAMYQILNGGMNVSPDTFFIPAQTVCTRGHTKKLWKPQAHSRVRRHTLAARAVNDWNDLPPSVVQATSVNQFKARLDEHWNQFTFSIND